MAPRRNNDPSGNHHQFYRKFRPGEMINSQAKQVILNVFFHISSLHPEKSWNKVALEAAALTGVCSKTIFKLKSEKQASLYLDNPPPKEPSPNENLTGEEALDAEGNPIPLTGPDGAPLPKPPAKKRKKGEKREKKEPRPPSPRSIKRKCTVRPKKRIERYDESVLTAIRLKMHEYLGRNEPPTVSKVLGDINMDEQLPNFSRSTFHRILKDMGLNTYLQTPHGPKKKVKPEGAPGPGTVTQQQTHVMPPLHPIHPTHANPPPPMNYGPQPIRDHHPQPMHNVSRMGFQ